jgi:hypothetical protein
MKEKYFGDISNEDWIRQEPKSYRGASIVWKGLVKTFPVIGS